LKELKIGVDHDFCWNPDDVSCSRKANKVGTNLIEAVDKGKCSANAPCGIGEGDCDTDD